MKKACFISVVLICVVFAFAGCSNNENRKDIRIDKEDIENRLLYNKISNSLNKKYLEQVFSDAFEQQYQSVIRPENVDEIEMSLIEDLAIIKLCKEKGILIEQDFSEKKAQIEFDNLNKDSSQNRYTTILKNVLSEYELSEKDYLDLLCEDAYYRYNRQALKSYFNKNLYQENSNETLDEQFDAYIETLLK